jgi:hypothetical protein
MLAIGSSIPNDTIFFLGAINYKPSIHGWMPVEVGRSCCIVRFRGKARRRAAAMFTWPGEILNIPKWGLSNLDFDTAG